MRLWKERERERRKMNKRGVEVRRRNFRPTAAEVKDGDDDDDIIKL